MRTTRYFKHAFSSIKSEMSNLYRLPEYTQRHLSLLVSQTNVLSRPLSIHDDPDNLVILVHGFLDNLSIFKTIQQEINNCTHSNLYSIEYSSTTANFESISESLHRLLIRLEKLNKPIILIGHSLGGVIIRHTLQSQQSASYISNVCSVFTIATPHNGTQWVNFVNLTTRENNIVKQNPLVKALHPDSSIINELKHPLETRANYIIYSFWTPQDTIILPVTHAEAHHSHINIINTCILGEGHAGIINHPLILKKIIKELS